MPINSSRRHNQRRLFVVSGVVTAIFAIGAASALAAPRVTEYPTQPNARTFDTDSGGWAPEIEINGVCVPSLTCPNVSAGFVAEGGAGGSGGYLTTQISPPDSLAAALTESTVTFRSPPFRYTGAGGQDPDRVTFRITRQAEVAKFLSLLDDSADFSVQIVDVTGDVQREALTLVPKQTLDDAPAWARVQPVHLDPDELDRGNRYRIEIITTYVTDVILFPDANADYDNVRLRAVYNPNTTDNKPNISITVLRRFFKQGPPKSVVVKNGKMLVRARCPRQAPTSCRIAATGLTNKGGARITETRRKLVRPGGAKTFRLKVRNPVTSDHATIRLRVQTGSTRATVFKRVKLRFK